MTMHESVLGLLGLGLEFTDCQLQHLMKHGFSAGYMTFHDLWGLVLQD